MKWYLIFVVGFTLNCSAWANQAKPGPLNELNQYFIELEQIALKEGDFGPDKHGLSEFAQQIFRSQNLAEKRMYEDAAVILSALLEKEIASDWKAMLTTRLEILRKWMTTRTVELSDYRTFYESTGPEWFRDRAKPIIALWKMEEVNEAEKFLLLRDLLRKRNDKVGEQLILKAIAASSNSTPEVASNALLDAANLHYKSRNYLQAEELWIDTMKKFPDTAAWGKAVFNLGMLHKDQGDFSRAFEYFTSILSANVDDREPGSHLMESYQNYRPRAQWEIANILFTQGDYEGALNAYRTTEQKYPFQSWCGNGLAEYNYRFGFYQGVCFEYLGHTQLAIRKYYRAITTSHLLYFDPLAYTRIVDIYQAADKIEVLNKILEEIDKEAVVRFSSQRGTEFDTKDLSMLPQYYSPATTLRAIIKIRQLAAKSDWYTLISYIKPKNSVAGPEEGYARRDNWEAIEAIRQLAKHPEHSTPYLIIELKKGIREKAKWIYYALGSCGTEEAVQILKAAAFEETNIWWTNSIVYSLAQAGPRGEQVIKNLEQVAKNNLKTSIERHRSGKLRRGLIAPHFPEVPENVTLPASLKEITES